MKINIKNVVLFLILTACSSQKRILQNHNLCSSETTLFSDEYMLDTLQFKKLKVTYQPQVFYEDSRLKKEVAKKSDEIRIYIQDKKNKVSKWRYYKNLKLHKEREVFNLKMHTDYNFLYINDAKFYNNKGNVIKVIDYRQKDKYPLCYKQALMLVEKWKPKDYEINHINRDSIVNSKGITYTWMVHVRHPVKARNEAKMYLYTIDAKTGKKLKKVETLLGTNDDL